MSPFELGELFDMDDKDMQAKLMEITTLLYQNPKGLTWYQLKNMTGFDPATLVRHVGVLKNYGVLYEDGSTGKELYRLTSKGLEFATSMTLGIIYAEEQ
jgi:DNA-binding IclR family transcriptional regulator